MKKIGLIINPVAGMGGSVGLKGTDHVVEEALRRGAVPGSEKRAETALRELLPYKDELLICTGAGHMGGELAQRMGFRTEVLPAGTDTGAAPRGCSYFGGFKNPGGCRHPADLKTPADTDILAASAFCFATAGSDTIALGKRLLNEQADLLLFAGGDGTARDIYQAVGTELVCVGIPAGVKIHSPVYAKNPGAPESWPPCGCPDGSNGTRRRRFLISTRTLIAAGTLTQRFMDILKFRRSGR